MADFVKVVGLKELNDAFNLAPQNLERRAMGEAVRAGGRVLEEAVRARAPRDSGDLAQNIEVKIKIIPRRGIASAIIGVIYRRIVAKSSRSGKTPSTEDPGVYAQFVEFGRPNRQGHTHQAAHPFMRPAFDTESDAATTAFADALRARLGDLVVK